MAELELVRVDKGGRVLVLRAPDGTEHALPVTDALTAALARSGTGAAAPTTGAPTTGESDTGASDTGTSGTAASTTAALAAATSPTDGTSAAASRASSTAPSAAPTDATPHEPTLRPRDLQARLRAGATAEELAAEAGMPVENVRRYEWPVIAERNHVISMVRAHEVPGLDGTAELGTIADARLAARGVNPPDATWSARREGTAPWVVEIRFWAGDRDRSARWTFDQRGRLVTPLDDEARWLGQPDEPLTPQVRPVPALGSRRGASSADRAAGPRGAAAWTDRDETDVLLDDLAGRRGHRPRSRDVRPPTAPLPVGSAHNPAAGEDGGFPVIPLGDLLAPGNRHESAASAEHESARSASVVDIGRWNPRRSRDKSVSPGGGPDGKQPALFTPTGVEPREPRESRTPQGSHKTAPGAHETAPRSHEPAARVVAPDVAPDVASDAPEERPVASPDRPQAAPRGTSAARRKGRAQVPSWDEIVFGARPEPG